MHFTPCFLPSTTPLHESRRSGFNITIGFDSEGLPSSLSLANKTALGSIATPPYTNNITIQSLYGPNANGGKIAFVDSVILTPEAEAEHLGEDEQRNLLEETCLELSSAHSW
jgi:hypothetical protein